MRGASERGKTIQEEQRVDFQRRTSFRRSRWNVVGVPTEPLPDASFDVVCIGGALHHFHPGVQSAIDELHRVLKPGGILCFNEPHAGSLPDIARKIWYRFGFYLRIPCAARPYYAPICLRLEPLVAPWQRRWSSFFVLGRWRRRGPIELDSVRV